MITEHQTVKSRQVALLLRDAFTWSDSKQGHDYWSKVNEALENMQKKVKTCRKCGRELDAE